MSTLQIRSPKATRVKLVSGTPGALVKAGSPLFELQDFEESALASKAQRQIDENQAKLAEVSGGRVKAKLGHLAEISKQRLAALKPTQDNYSDLCERYKMGQLGYKDYSVIMKARHSLSLRTYEALQATVELKIYQRNIDDSVKILTTIDNLLRKELEYITSLRSRLKIVAPTDGNFVSHVSTGDPVPLGFVLGEIK